MSVLNVTNLSHGFGDRAIFENVSFRAFLRFAIPIARCVFPSVPSCRRKKVRFAHLNPSGAPRQLPFQGRLSLL